MDILVGIFYIIILCSLILVLASFAISQYKNHDIVNKTKKKDDYSYLFEVYSK